MGKCIVCNKSAGPFYSLHKACYQVYEDTRKCLQQVLDKSIESSEPADEFAEALNGCRPSSSFSVRLFESLLKQAWQDQAKQIIKSKILNAKHADYLLNVTSVLEIEDKDVEPHLFTRLANIEHLVCINQGLPISKNFTNLHNEIDIENNESLIWVFEDTLKVEKQRPIKEKEWTVFQSILNNIFMKSRYKELDTRLEDVGKFAISNQNLYYVAKKETTRISFADIYAITPMDDGVRIQTAQRNTTPNTYITGDGRFTYALLRYAQDQKLTG